jgi:hypothetical protein
MLSVLFHPTSTATLLMKHLDCANGIDVNTLTSKDIGECNAVRSLSLWVKEVDADPIRSFL